MVQLKESGSLYHHAKEDDRLKDKDKDKDKKQEKDLDF